MYKYIVAATAGALLLMAGCVYQAAHASETPECQGGPSYVEATFIQGLRDQGVTVTKLLPSQIAIMEAKGITPGVDHDGQYVAKKDDVGKFFAVKGGCFIVGSPMIPVTRINEILGEVDAAVPGERNG